MPPSVCRAAGRRLVFAACAHRVLDGLHAAQRGHTVDDGMPFRFFHLPAQAHVPVLDGHVDVARTLDQMAQRGMHAFGDQCVVSVVRFACVFA